VAEPTAAKGQNLTSPPENLFFLPFGDRILAFTVQEFQAALERGRLLAGTATATPPAEPEKLLLTAEAMQERTDVPAGWFLEAARAGAVPHHKIGRYVRFQFDEVIACLRFRSRAVQGAGGKAP
jgi:hypothetical protein